jgi:hypothetical protein
MKKGMRRTPSSVMVLFLNLGWKWEKLGSGGRFCVSSHLHADDVQHANPWSVDWSSAHMS